MTDFFAPFETYRTEFQTLGFVIARGVLSTGALLQIRREVEAFSPARREAEHADEYDAAFWATSNLWATMPKLQEFWLASPLADAARSLLSATDAVLSHDHLFWKRGGDGPTPIHADQYGLPLCGATVTAWVPLQDTSATNGSVFYFPRSHRLPEEFHRAVGGRNSKPVGDELEGRGFETCVTSLELGDVAFHDGWTYHGATSNSAEVARFAVSATYVDGDARFAVPLAGGSFEALSERYYPGAQLGSKVSATPFAADRKAILAVS